MIIPTYSFICAGGDGNRAVCPPQTPSQLPFSASLSLRLWNRNILSWLAELFPCCTQAFWAPYQIHSRRCSQLVMCSLALVQHFMSWKVPEELLWDKAGLRYSQLNLIEASEPNPKVQVRESVESVLEARVFCLDKQQGAELSISCNQQERWWGTKKAPLHEAGALNAPPKLGISVGN